ncbi:MAG: hypothetical protein N2512_07790, partial [Armatimonadetes bacterium]|nr:hypothetical protein [Armatimonadota bacterium]
MLMVDVLLGVAILAPAAVSALQASQTSPRLHMLFDDGWQFLRGDAADAWKPDFDDSDWQKVDLP